MTSNDGVSRGNDDCDDVSKTKDVDECNSESKHCDDGNTIRKGDDEEGDASSWKVFTLSWTHQPGTRTKHR